MVALLLAEVELLLLALVVELLLLPQVLVLLLELPHQARQLAQQALSL